MHSSTSKANIKNKFTEDDSLSLLGDKLKKSLFTLLAISGNQQGMYIYRIGKYRKSPDIVAVKNNNIIVGEAKTIASDSFRMDKRGISDYSSMCHLFDSIDAKQELIGRIEMKLEQLKLPIFTNWNLIPFIYSLTPYDMLLNSKISALSLDPYTKILNLEKDILRIGDLL